MLTKKISMLTRSSNLFAFVIQGIFLMYILDLEKNKCECSEHWKRDYLKYHITAGIILNLLFIFMPQLIQSPLFQKFIPILGILGILYVYSIFTWTRQLRHENCECSFDWKRTFMEYYSYFIIGAVILQIISIIILIYQLKIMLNQVKKTK